MTLPQIPTSRGSYFLVFYLQHSQTLQIGKAGHIHFLSGMYVYSGSAFGPGGLSARISRHLSNTKKQRWHLDWIRPTLTFRYGWYVLEHHYECLWSTEVLKLPGCLTPLKKMGSSDCKNGCAAHFFRLPEQISLDDLEKYLICTQNEELHRFY